VKYLALLLLLFRTKIAKGPVHCHVFASHRQAGAPVINIQSTLRTAPDLCKSVPLAAIFGTNSNHIQSLRSQMCVCVYRHTHTYSSQYGDSGRKMEVKTIGTVVNAAYEENILVCHFGHGCHLFVSLGLGLETSPAFISAPKNSICTCPLSLTHIPHQDYLPTDLLHGARSFLRI
jgi:hypothetical protein